MDYPNIIVSNQKEDFISIQKGLINIDEYCPWPVSDNVVIIPLLHSCIFHLRQLLSALTYREDSSGFSKGVIDGWQVHN